jgi:hypothetical protein
MYFLIEGDHRVSEYLELKLGYEMNFRKKNTRGRRSKEEKRLSSYLRVELAIVGKEGIWKLEKGVKLITGFQSGLSTMQNIE